MSSKSAAEAQRGAGSGDQAGRDRPAVGGVDLYSYGNAPWPGVDCGRHRSQRLTEHDMRPTVKQAKHLRVALDRHRRNGPFGRELQKFETHLPGQRAAAGVHQPLHQLRIEIVGDDDSHRLLPGERRGVGGRR